MEALLRVAPATVWRRAALVSSVVAAAHLAADHASNTVSVWAYGLLACVSAVVALVTGLLLWTRVLWQRGAPLLGVMAVLMVAFAAGEGLMVGLAFRSPQMAMMPLRDMGPLLLYGSAVHLWTMPLALGLVVANLWRARTPSPMRFTVHLMLLGGLITVVSLAIPLPLRAELSQSAGLALVPLFIIAALLMSISQAASVPRVMGALAVWMSLGLLWLPVWRLLDIRGSWGASVDLLVAIGVVWASIDDLLAALDVEQEKRALLEENNRQMTELQSQLTGLTRDLFAVNQIAQSALNTDDEHQLLVALSLDLADEFDGVVSRVWACDDGAFVLASEAGAPVACRVLQYDAAREQMRQAQEGLLLRGTALESLLPAKAKRLQVECLVVTPVVVDGEVRGAIELWSRQDLQESVLENLDLLARIIGVALRRIHTEQSLEHQVASRTQELQVAIAHAEEANQLKSAFLANMSHELRTPLHAVLSFARFGQKKAGRASLEKLVGYFEQIQSSGELLLRLVNDLLDLSKLEAGRMDLLREPTSLKTLVQSVCDELEVLFAEKELDVHILAADLEPLALDKKRMAQVVRNLLSNALKFSPRGGRIQVLVQSMNDGAGVRLSVEDEGVGIPPGELELVFDKFSQSSATKTGAGGTGLGLPICRELTEAHHGRLWAENRDVGGAVFHLELPRAQNSDREADDTQERARRMLRG